MNLAISRHGWRLANKKSVGERNIGTDCWLPMSCIWPTTTSCTRLKARQWHCWSLSSWWQTPIVKSYDHWTLIVFNIGQAPINRLQWRPVRLIPGRNWIWKQIFNDLNDFLINYEDFLGSNICNASNKKIQIGKQKSGTGSINNDQIVVIWSKTCETKHFPLLQIGWIDLKLSFPDLSSSMTSNIEKLTNWWHIVLC